MLVLKLIHISKRGTNPDSKVHGSNLGPPGSCRPQMGSMFVPWTLLSGKCSTSPVAVWSMSCHLGGVRNAQLFITRSHRDCISHSCGFNRFLGFKHWSPNTWWRHQMETFSVLLVLCVGNSPVTSEFPSQKPSHAELWCFLWSAP